VIAPLLIIQRVASKSALMTETTVSGRVNLFEVGGREEFASGRGAPPGGNPVSFVDERRMNSSGELGVWVKTTVDFHQDRV